MDRGRTPNHAARRGDLLVALADYFGRSALAAAQVIGGDFEESRFKEILEATPVGISIGPAASEKAEARAIADMSVRLLARLYPTLVITGSAGHVSEVS